MLAITGAMSRLSASRNANPWFALRVVDETGPDCGGFVGGGEHSLTKEKGRANYYVEGPLQGRRRRLVRQLGVQALLIVSERL
jgi:hypothetical protein